MMDATSRLYALCLDLEQKQQLTPTQFRMLKQLIDSNHHKLVTAIDTYDQPNQQEILESVLFSVIEETLSTLINYVFLSCPTLTARKISKADRLRIEAPPKVTDAALVYGEVSFDSMVNILWKSGLKMRDGGVFYDLGSGIGRAILSAALLHDFKRCVGIEVLPGLVQESQRLLQRYNRETRPRLPQEQQNMDIEFVHANFLEYDWSDGDIVFVNSTCYDHELMVQISSKVETLKHGALVITCTKEIHTPLFTKLHSHVWKTSWGHATVHVYQSVKDNTT